MPQRSALIKNAILTFTVSLLMSVSTYTLAALAPPTNNFRVFNAMLYKDMPANLGERTAVVYEQTFFTDSIARDDGTPSDEGIRKAVQNGANQAGPPIRATGSLTVMDVELWPVWPFVTGDAHKASIKRYASTLDRFGDALGNEVCAYAIAPQAGINHANLALKNPDIRQQWTEHSNITRDMMVPHADALCPSLYAYYADTDGSGNQIEYWKNFAIETIKEARRIAPGKPVYPFIWPQFHQGGGMSDYSYIPAQYWRVIVETVRDNADGVVLWGGQDLGKGGQLKWNEEAEWVAITRDVLDL